MSIRQLTELDAEAYRDLRLEALQQNADAFATVFEEELKKSLDYYQKRFKQNNVWTFGYFDENQLVGVVTLIREQAKKLQHRSMIVAMYVTPKIRKNGIGKQLMQFAIHQAEAIKGLEQIYLAVVTNNTAAIALYQSLDFEIYGTEKRAIKLDDSTYWDEHRMVLYL